MYRTSIGINYLIVCTVGKSQQLVPDKGQFLSPKYIIIIFGLLKLLK